MKKILIFGIILMVTFGVLLVTNPVLALDARTDLDAQDTAFIQASGLQKTSLGNVIAGVIRAVLSLLGLLFVVLTIYAGFMWMTAAGNDDKIATAKKTLVAAVIGLIIILSAYAITFFIFYSMQNISTRT